MNKTTDQKTGEGKPRVWKDTPASTAEQIEMSMRRSNSRMREALESIQKNANFVLANSDNATSKVFCEAVLRIVRKGLAA